MVTPPSQFPLQLSCSCTALLTTPLVACTHHPRFITHGNNKTMTLMETTREFVSFDKSSLRYNVPLPVCSEGSKWRQGMDKK